MPRLGRSLALPCRGFPARRGQNGRTPIKLPASFARTVIPLQLVADKSRLQALVAAIESEGSTNLTAGWMLGRDEVAKAPEELPRKVLLLTDGQTNTGIIEPAQIRQIVGQGLEQDRVHSSCLGFGDEYNEDLLDDLAKVAGGALHDADSPERFPKIFRQELDSLLKLSAQNAMRSGVLWKAARLGASGSRITGNGPAGGLGRRVRSRTTPNSLCGSCNR
jgi:hypothetical protein